MLVYIFSLVELLVIILAPVNVHLVRFFHICSKNENLFVV